MRKHNCYIINKEMIRDLQSRWPCSGLSDRVSYIEFVLDDGDLVDLDYFDRHNSPMTAKLVGEPEADFINALIEDATLDERCRKK